MPHTISPSRQEFARALARMVDVDLTPEFADFSFDDAREQMGNGGVRAGKSTAGSFKLFNKEWFHHKASGGAKSDRLYWLVGATYGTPTNEEFRYLKAWFMRTGLLKPSKGNPSEPLDGEKRMSLINGTNIVTMSATNPEKLASVAPDMILVCEAGSVSDEVRGMLKERSLEKKAQIVYTGTFEDDTNHRQWAWYSECAQEWRDLMNEEFSAYSLPSWTNRKLFPGGREDPEILKIERDFLKESGGDYKFLRRIAGVPAGNPYTVYPEMTLKREKLLVEVPDQRWTGGIGGIDWGTSGTGHLTVATAGTVTVNGVIVVRECVWSDKPDASFWLSQQRQRLSHVYRIQNQNWYVDPLERYLAQSNMATAVSGSAGARNRRQGLTMNRLESDRLLFDMNGPGVVELFEEMSKVHRRKNRAGEIVYVREADDRAATVENMCEGLDSFQGEIPRPRYLKRTYPKGRRTQEFAVRV